MPPPLLLVLLLIPVVVGLGGWVWGGNRLTWWELAVQVVVVSALLVAGYLLGQWATVADVEVWSGRVASKPHGHMRCCHTYRCHCHRSCTGSGGQRSCTRQCSTCRRHEFDLYWRALSTNNERVYDNKCNRPGTAEPGSWTVIRVGEPTAHEHPYDNFVRAAPHRFVRGSDALVARYGAHLPPYPRLRGLSARRFVNAGVAEPRAVQYAAKLARLNADLFVQGRRQANLMIVVTPNAEREYFDALQRKWLGGKRNDVVVVVAAPAYPKIAWARVMAWAASRSFSGDLAHAVEGLGTFDIDRVLAVMERAVRHDYRPLPATYFKRVAGRVSPPRIVLVGLFVGGLLLSAVLQIVFLTNRYRRKGAGRGRGSHQRHPRRRRRRRRG